MLLLEVFSFPIVFYFINHRFGTLFELSNLVIELIATIISHLVEKISIIFI